MTSWFGNQWGKFLSSMPENIGVFAVIFFLLFIAVSALFSLTKRFMQNIDALAAAIVSAFVSFLLVDSIYGILLKREGIQAAINELLEKFPELGASSEGVVAVSKFVVSLVAVPALFLIVYGIFSLVTSIIFRKYQKEGVSSGKKAESNISSTVKIIIGVLSGVAAFVAYFFPSHSFVDLTRHEYFRHNDAYFDRYDEDKFMKLIVRTANEYDEKEMGDFCIAFRAANEQVRDYIVDMLWNRGKLSDIIGRAKEVIKKKKKKALLEGKLIMSAQKGLLTAYFWIMPEKNGRK